MDIDFSIKKDFENKLLNRREIFCEVIYSGVTPNREKIKEEISKKLNLNPKLTVIAKINQLFGTTKSEVSVYSYNNEEAMKIEQEFKAERSNKKKPEESAKAEAAKEEAAKTNEKEKK
ncbi:MAG: hypothetical protein ACP5RT_02965 [Candidatus Micrarchaeia archaeon]